ncbi:DNA-processing protein DprA [Leptospira sp. GIMC2001]|uniref:DNA-processing protein DprA n=1 Tax=Leptospira sp. GIMC2001 TaxID=1513297 RepID=UPI0023490E02|nr:DNA-processing protein DprA [Leptospira sp. GIMC2001]WCL49883.1 DNA-protecting protein DprA [Leptospira sp. GIMC2001]
MELQDPYLFRHFNSKQYAYSFFGKSNVRTFIYKNGLLDKAKSLHELGELVLNYLDRKIAQEWILEGERCDEIYKSKGATFVSYYDPLYPNLLKEIYDPPLVLFCIGSIEVLKSDFIAIVGTRKASPVSLFATNQLVHSIFIDSLKNQLNRDSTCIQQDFFHEVNLKDSLGGKGIVSGMALGIDREAMATAIDLGLPTLGILGTPVYTEYPYSNRSLYAKMKNSKNGLLVSELLPYDHYAKWTFPMRNRIITGIAKSVYLMETPAQSGAMSSANNAIEQNKEIFIFDHPIQFNNDGGKNLLEDGANPIQFPDLGIRGNIFHITELMNQSKYQLYQDLVVQLKLDENSGKAKNLGGGYYFIF